MHFTGFRAITHRGTLEHDKVGDALSAVERVFVCLFGGACGTGLCRYPPLSPQQPKVHNHKRGGLGSLGNYGGGTWLSVDCSGGAKRVGVGDVTRGGLQLLQTHWCLTIEPHQDVYQCSRGTCLFCRPAMRVWGLGSPSPRSIPLVPLVWMSWLVPLLDPGLFLFSVTSGLATWVLPGLEDYPSTGGGAWHRPSTPALQHSSTSGDPACHWLMLNV